MNLLCVIPARIDSTRLPRKMLADINGTPLIAMTYSNAKRCQSIDRLIVATDSEEIASVIRSVGGEVVMTPSDLPTGSDRVAAVSAQFPQYDVVINLQGDEPLIKPEMLDTLVEPYRQGKNPPMATVAYSLKPDEYDDPNIVKVILDQQGYAIYFSRAAIPYYRKTVTHLPQYHHMGLYAYRQDFLQQFTQLAQTPLEQSEALEQLRALEHGYKIYVSLSELRTLEVNTLDELNAVRAALRDREEVVIS